MIAGWPEVLLHAFTGGWAVALTWRYYRLERAVRELLAADLDM